VLGVAELAARAYSMLARIHAADGLKRRVEQLMVRMEVTADDVGALATGTVPQYRQRPPWQRIEQLQDGNLVRRLRSAHRMLFAVRQDDDVALPSPEAFAAPHLNPASAGGDDVKDDQPRRVRPEYLGHLVRRR
jgi:hypothetical protein